MKAETLNPAATPTLVWRFSSRERAGLVAALCVVLGFGANLEQRTALRRVPKTDLGVFACAAWAVGHGENLYTVSDWHGWHYQYPPFLAILLRPLAHPLPASLPPPSAGERRTESNTPWGYGVAGGARFFGLHRENLRFFWIVAVWYFISVLLVGFSAHALACTLERRRLRDPPPIDKGERRRWWALRTLPLTVCIGSIGTEFSRGQMDVVMLGAIALALYLAARGREFSGGVLLSVPAAIKLFPPLLLLYPLWRGRWGMAGGVFAGLVVALVVLPALALGPGRTAALYRDWFEVLAKPALGQGQDSSRAKELTGMNATDNQSLLVFIHNWRHHDLPRKQRPPEAAPATRFAVYGIGAAMLLGVGIVSGLRRQDSPRELLIIAGLLIGLALVLSPIVHNFYYLLLLPLVAALLDRSFSQGGSRAAIWRLSWVVVVFAVTDILARLPGIGAWMRDAGLPLLSLLGLLCAGAIQVFRPECGLK